MSDRHSARATVALRRLGEADPAFAALALWCRHRDADRDPDDGAAAAWTDGRTIFYGPGFAALPLHEQAGLAAHQILHVAFRHASRSRAMLGRFGDRFDDELFNLATDALVNETLVAAGHALPRPCVLLGALLAEVTGEPVAPEPALAAWDAERLYLRLAEPGGTRGRPGRGDGPAAGPSTAERARAYARAQGFAEDLDARAADPAAAPDAQEEADWRQRLARALEAGRQAGRGIGAVGHRLADLPRVRTPWEVVLRGLVTKAVTRPPRRAWSRPTRRWIARDSEARRTGGPEPVFEPGSVRAPEVPRVAVGLDASSSVDSGLLARFAGQIAGIGRRTGAEIHVLVFDDAVRARLRLRGPAWERELLRLDLPRGGGTSFVAVVEEARQLDPSVIVILTDLEGPAGPRPGRIPVIWAVQGLARPAPFGTVLSLSG